jgi:hypothetical protein
MSRFEKKRLVRLWSPLLKGFAFLLFLALLAGFGGDTTLADMLARIV